MTTMTLRPSIRTLIAAQKGYSSWEEWQTAKAALVELERAATARAARVVVPCEFYLCTMGRGFWFVTAEEHARSAALVAAGERTYGDIDTYHRRPDGRVVRFAR